MRIDIWSDVVCPWCWIGKRRLQAGIALLGRDAPDIEIHWHPFLLDPDADATPVPLRDALAVKFGGAERVAQMLAQTQATARAEGLPFDFDRGQVRVTTLPAHRLMALAAGKGAVDAVGEALFHAHFAEGRNVADVEVLVEAGVAGGLDADRVRRFLASDAGEAEVQDRVAQARAMGIRAVPTFVIDGRLAVQGAQPPEAIADALRQAMRSPTPVAPSAPACGPSGCD
ncbi:polyketide synthase [Xanthomonas sp. Mitacek01]|nr:polyketide synthase [Xanthomonas sp. Mitacek01]